MKITKENCRTANRKVLLVKDFNEVLSCHLCNGYLINPTTVDNCFHTYCRSCILKHLLRDKFCPQCKAPGCKQISTTNLKSDDILRAFIYKIMPGLYKEERDYVLQQSASNRNGLKTDDKDVEAENEYFLPTEPISLSLEYHEALLSDCSNAQMPPVRYLQCPAGLKIHHLKRFLCSKYDINPENKLIEVEIIYEEEVLPSDFTLMDVGYCYNWNRQTPMKFRYRILLHSGECQSSQNEECNISKAVKSDALANEMLPPPTQAVKAKPAEQGKAANFPENTGTFVKPSVSTVLKYEAQSSLTAANKNKLKHRSTELKESPDSAGNTPVKMIIARKPAESKKQMLKRASMEDNAYAITSDFKSLRSNDMRYSDYTAPPKAPTTNKEKAVLVAAETSPEAHVTKCEIVVSIPQSQISKSSAEEQLENVTLAQLKTASKKSPNALADAAEQAKKPKNVPKLKIELNSLKTTYTIPKPKSADSRLENNAGKKFKYRNHSLDEVAPTADKVDLATYAKHIGLKPIEVATPTESTAEFSKYSPNASPMSSSSSTTSSSNGNLALGALAEFPTSFHKKRKKKHSRDSKDGKDSKRHKLHAEISSQPADESLKMKVKITASHNHKSHKLEAKKSALSKAEAAKTSSKAAVDAQAGEKSLSVLNRTLREESNSINNLMKQKPAKVVKDALPPVVAGPADAATNAVPKSIVAIKDAKLPPSPPLPPSLFKTAPLPFPTTLAGAPTTTAALKVTTAAQKQQDAGKEKAATHASVKALPVLKLHAVSAEKLSGNHKNPHFAVPNPPRPIPHAHKFLSTPTSIASAAGKQMGMQLKRSASLDESSTAAKQLKLDQDRQVRKTAYGAFQGSAQMRPFYSAMPAAYGPELAQRKTTGASAAPSPINICKSNETPYGSTTGSTNAGAARQRATQIGLSPYAQPGMLHKPALEIVCIKANPTPIKPLPPLSPPKSRLMGPPLPTLKPKKTANQTATISSAFAPALKVATAATIAAKHNTAYRTSPPALVNLRNNFQVKTQISSVDTSGRKVAAEVPKANGSVDKAKPSLREFRPASKDSAADILDLSAAKAQDSLTESVKSPSISNSLQATLNKLKQNIASDSASSTMAAKKASSSEGAFNDDLQNLHMLSESATAREKIAIKNQLYEKPKLQQPSMVRQQNASVRNIPNPSALAFRNQPSSIPAVKATATPVLPQKKTALPSPTSTTTTATPSLTTPLSPNAATTVQSPPSRSTKKPTTIDQVAATLNIRAAAAEASAAKAAIAEEATDVVQVSSTSALGSEKEKKEVLSSAAVDGSKAKATSSSVEVKKCAVQLSACDTTAQTKASAGIGSLTKLKTSANDKAGSNLTSTA